jgi:hypothetical protein
MDTATAHTETSIRPKVTVAVLGLVAAATLGCTAPGRPTIPPTTGSATTTSQHEALVAWYNTAQSSVQDLGDAWVKVSEAAKHNNIAAVGVFCQQAHEADDELQQHMPSPDPELTAALQKAMSDYDAGTRLCTSAVESDNLDDLDQATNLLAEANKEMNTAVEILHRGLFGPRGPTE